MREYHFVGVQFSAELKITMGKVSDSELKGTL